MLPLRALRQDPDTLIWEYLDGEISPRRASRLSNLLRRRPKVRKRLVESALLHGLLYQYFLDESRGQAQEQPPRRRKHGRSPAA